MGSLLQDFAVQRLSTFLDEPLPHLVFGRAIGQPRTVGLVEHGNLEYARPTLEAGLATGRTASPHAERFRHRQPGLFKQLSFHVADRVRLRALPA